MIFEEHMVKAYNDALAGKTINEVVGDWHVSNVNCARDLELQYGSDALYGFDLLCKDDFIQFFNYHREARTGTGTLSLKQLESSFSALAKNRDKRVVSFFELFGQKDTEVWLKKNNYTPNEQGIYYKVFEASQ